MILLPATSHVVRWTKQNLLDETTYYPYAIIRDTRENTILDSFALPQIAAGRFAKSWPVVQDPTGLGREIEVEITIYEDPGHTQVSGVYGRWTESYTIFDLAARQQLGGAYIDYKYIEQLFEKKLKEYVASIPEQQKVDLSGMVARVGELASIVKRMADAMAAVGERTERMDEIEKSLTEAFSELTALLGKSPNDLSEASDRAAQALEQAILAAADKAVAKLDGREGKIAAATDAELTHIVDSFKTVIETVAGGIRDDIKAASENLRKPMTVTFKDIETVKEDSEDRKREKKNEQRIGRFT